MFRTTGVVTLPQSICYVMTRRGEERPQRGHMPILASKLPICTIEALGEGSAKVIIKRGQKRLAGNARMSAKSDPEGTSQPVSLDIKYSEQVDSNNLAFLFAWPRFQFRHATNKNVAPGICSRSFIWVDCNPIYQSEKLPLPKQHHRLRSSFAAGTRKSNGHVKTRLSEQNPELAEVDQGRGRCRDRQVQGKISDLDEQDEQD
ncbi:p53-like transcription factor [Penicillium sp. IBT 35674x]|nr:p53-like transcription factor [Penicillium sp. IBT 35674x]